MDNKITEKDLLNWKGEDDLVSYLLGTIYLTDIADVYFVADVI